MSVPSIVKKCQEVDREIGNYIKHVPKSDLTGYSVLVENGTLQVSIEAEQDESRNALTDAQIEKIAKSFRKKVR